MTFEAIEAEGVEGFLEQLREELVQRSISAPTGAEGGDTEGRGKDSASFRFHRFGTEWSRER